MIGQEIHFKYTFIVRSTRDSFDEYIQGIVRSVDKDFFEVEQFLTYQDYILGNAYESVRRNFNYKEVDFGKFIFPH